MHFHTIYLIFKAMHSNYLVGNFIYQIRMEINLRKIFHFLVRELLEFIEKTFLITIIIKIKPFRKS